MLKSQRILFLFHFVLLSSELCNITYAWESSYGFGPAAVSKINNAVRGGGNGVEQLKETDHEYMRPSGAPQAQEEKMGGEKEMGFLNVLDSAVSGVKTPVSNALRSSYSLGSTAVSKINKDAVLKGVEKLKEYMPGPEGREEIICLALTLVTHPAAKELLKLVTSPGGAQAYNIVAALLKNQPSTSANYSLHESKRYEQVMEQLKVLRDEYDKMRADLKHIKELEFSPSKLNSTSTTTTTTTTTTPVRFKSSTTVEQTPEEVISVFMMKGLKVRDFLDDQIVPPIRGSMENQE